MSHSHEDMKRVVPSSTVERNRGRRGLGSLVVATLLGYGAAGMSGCLDTDSWLLDPSVAGRWEHTPTVVPILERIDVIERDTGEFVDVTSVEPEDLIPEPADYRVAPGDLLEIEILDFIQTGVISPYSRVVSQRGFINLPQIGVLDVHDRNRGEIEEMIRQAIIDALIIDDPLVTVQIPGRQQATFSVFGAISGVGRYAIPTPDYRLLQALTDAGGVSPAIPKVMIIRQVTLTGDETPALDLPDPAPEQNTNDPDLLDLIDDLTAPDSRLDSSADDPNMPSPALFAGEYPSRRRGVKQAITSNQRELARQLFEHRLAQAQTQPPEDTPPIELPETDDPALQLRPGTPVVQPQAMPAAGRWVFLNGEWVQVISGDTVGQAGGLGEGADPLASAQDAGPLVTQRVIEVPTKPLLQGMASYNVVIRPGDVISVPGPEQGLVYIGGPGINRTGVYNLPPTGKLTLQRLVFSAGGFSAIAIPQRVDLTRIVGGDRQATIRVNLKAIFSGTHPDILLKPDDLINVGTNFWATPLAIMRGGFRTSYGFGFLLDRNFGNDVFGAPPTNQFGR